jgi:hypothetical protein
MEYTLAQLKHIQKKLKRAATELEKGEQGMGAFCIYADYAVWASHANLAAYNVERHTGLMYKQQGNVKTYLEE